MPPRAPIPLLSYSAAQFHHIKRGRRRLSTSKRRSLVVRPTRCGKSFLASQLIAGRSLSIDNGSGGFDVRAGLHACTRGVWLWPVPQYVEISGRRTALLILDCQGVRDDDSDRLFCVAAALSSAVIYSQLGAIDEAQLELIASLFSDSSGAKPVTPQPFFQSPQLEPPPPPSPQHTPVFLWALRDFSLALRDGHGSPLTPSQYLEATLGAADKSVSNGGSPSRVGGRTGALLRRLLPRRDCVAMPRPVADEKLLPQMHRLPQSTLRPKWCHALAELRTKIIDGLAKPQGGAAAATTSAASPPTSPAQAPSATVATGYDALLTNIGDEYYLKIPPPPPLQERLIPGLPPWAIDGTALLAAARAAAHSLSGHNVRPCVPKATNACAAALEVVERERLALAAGAPVSVLLLPPRRRQHVRAPAHGLWEAPPTMGVQASRRSQPARPRSRPERRATLPPHPACTPRLSCSSAPTSLCTIRWLYATY